MKRKLRSGTLDHDTITDVMVHGIGQILKTDRGIVDLTWTFEDGRLTCAYEIWEDVTDTVDRLREWLRTREVDVSTIEKTADLIGHAMQYIYETTGRVDPEAVTEAILNLTDAGTLYAEADVDATKID